MPTWPGSLPQNCLREGFDNNVRPMHESSEVEDGRTVNELRTLVEASDMTLVYEMTGTQHDAFWTFWRTDLSYGSLAWDHPVPNPNSSYTTRSVKLLSKQTPRPSPMGGNRWRVSLPLYVRW